VGKEVVTLTFRHNYKLIWDSDLVHIFLIDGDMLTITEVQD